jgi:hypothetical protein
MLREMFLGIGEFLGHAALLQSPHFQSMTATSVPLPSLTNGLLRGYGLITLCACLRIGAAETLYNGIVLPDIWPPRDRDPNSFEPMPVPYLMNPPKVIPIDLGRQLFVDDFLVEETTLLREFHRPVKHSANPVLTSITDLERGDGLPVATPKSGGLWWDPTEQNYKLWYEAGWLGSLAYAISKDGLHWHRPALDPVNKSNRIVPDLRPDSTTVFLDYEARDPAERFKLFLREPGGPPTPGFALVSADGLHWSKPVATGPVGDRSTMFYNPFRHRWVFSIRSSGDGAIRRTATGRTRYYVEHPEFLAGAQWKESDVAFWVGADRLDPPDSQINQRPQLYNLDAVAYESLMLGIFQIHRGPTNEECMSQGMPKITDLTVAFSRDGFHWHRPDRTPFIRAERSAGTWDRGYVQSVGGICVVRADELWFYYIGFAGDATNTHPDWMKNGMYANGSCGIAILRRDGFASLNAPNEGGSITTRLVRFNGHHLFANVACATGELRAEVLDEFGSPLAPFTADKSVPVVVDSTRVALRWADMPDLSSIAGRPVRLRFHLKNGKLYSFWVTPDPSGASYGYVGAGGSEYSGGRDLPQPAKSMKAPTVQKALLEVPQNDTIPQP